MEVSIVKEHQKKVKAKSFWDSRKFAELMAHDKVAAASYCVDCGIDTEINGVPVKEIVKKGGIKKLEEAVKAPKNVEMVQLKATVKAPETAEDVIEDEVVDTTTDDSQDDVEISVEDLKELLKANDVKFHHMSGKDKLMKIANDNDLL